MADYLDYPKFYYGFHKGDTAILDFETLSKKGKQIIEVEHFDSKTVVYSHNAAFTERGIRIPIPETGVYEFEFGTNHAFGRKCRANIKRARGLNTPSSFDVNVQWITSYDTTYIDSQRQVLVSRDTTSQLVLNKEFRVYSINNANISRSYVVLNLPEGIDYWTLYLGVGQEATEQMKALGEKLSGSAALVGSPILAFGLGLIKHMPMWSATSTINFFMTDTENRQLFMNERDYGSYQYGPQGSNFFIYLANIPMSETPQDGQGLNFCFKNNDSWSGQNVKMRVYGFTTTDRYENQTETYQVVTQMKTPVLK